MEKEGAVETVLTLENVRGEEKKLHTGCFRMGENYRINEELPQGWGDCKTCLPDYLTSNSENFTPNKNCKGYIPCRVFWVVPREKSVEDK